MPNDLWWVFKNDLSHVWYEVTRGFQRWTWRGIIVATWVEGAVFGWWLGQ